MEKLFESLKHFRYWQFWVFRCQSQYKKDVSWSWKYTSVYFPHVLEPEEISKYEIDGLIVQANIEYTRNTTGNPDYAFAFKMRFEDNLIDLIKNLFNNLMFEQLRMSEILFEI